MNKYNNLPDDLQRYLEKHGWHFSEKLCRFAVENMYNNDKERIDKNSYSKEQTEELLRQFKVEVKNNKGYDSVYVLNMARSDYFGESVPGTKHLALFVRDYLDDEDGYEGIAFSRYLADCIAKRLEIEWDRYI
uniref:DUF7841 family protein n=1 Tax=Alistipes sp. TaxID=1872444 RepID=UPI0040563B93